MIPLPLCFSRPGRGCWEGEGGGEGEGSGGVEVLEKFVLFVPAVEEPLAEVVGRGGQVGYGEAADVDMDAANHPLHVLPQRRYGVLVGDGEVVDGVDVAVQSFDRGGEALGARYQGVDRRAQTVARA